MTAPSAWVAAIAVALVAVPAAAVPAAAADAPAEIPIAYLAQEIDRPPALSNLDWLQPPADRGLQGARLGIADNNATGRFTGHRFVLDERTVAADADAAAAAADLVAAGHRYLVINVAGPGLDRVVAALRGKDVLVFNAGAPDDRFRNEDCAPFLVHTLPSRAMLADALAQYLVKKNWKTWFLVTGPQPEDTLLADAFRRSAQRFGATIVATKAWTFSHDARRTAQSEVPLFTQVKDYDVLVVADEADLFGDVLMYTTWHPRPVAGTHGLVAVAWDRTVEQWGAAQLQSRFVRMAGRGMTDRDYAAWAAVRAVGEAVTRTASVAFEDVRRHLRGADFELAAFKGRALSFRPWNGQLRQPIPLTTPRIVVALSPQEGFLHQHTDLDTLGYDAPETRCSLR